MPTSSHKRVFLGIDPGLAITGYGVITYTQKEITCVASGAITSTPRESFGERLGKIHKSILKIIRTYRPSVMAIEELFFAKNAKTAIKVGQARGVAILAAWQCKIAVREFTPLQVKQAITGYGFASKSQIQKMVKLLLRLKSTPKPDDVADALAVAICCAQTKEF